MIMKLNINYGIRLAALVAILSTFGVIIACGATETPAVSQTNHPPVIQQVTGASDLFASSTADITCLAADPDGDKLTYSWSADNGTIQGTGSTISWTSPDTMGKYNISVTVSDGKGGEASKVQGVRIIANPNAAVVLKISLPSEEVVAGSKSVMRWTSSPIECLVENSDVKNLKFTWSVSGGKLEAGKGMNLDDGTASKVTWIAAYVVSGDFTVDVVVTDKDGNKAKGTVKFNVLCCE
jgi:hypothetical protein